MKILNLKKIGFSCVVSACAWKIDGDALFVEGELQVGAVETSHWVNLNQDNCGGC